MKILPGALFIGGVVALLVIGWVLPAVFIEDHLGYATQSMSDPIVILRVIMQPVLSLVLLAATLYVILSKSYQPKDKHWAYSTLGLVIGFWLKP